MENKRNTKQKQIILTLLKQTNRPLSINEIYNQVVIELPKIAKSTIYRNIDVLVGQNLIEKYHLNDNEVFYRIKASTNEHKHFVICDKCKKTFDLPICPIHEIEDALGEKGFQVNEHQIQITGICKNCLMQKGRDK